MTPPYLTALGAAWLKKADLLTSEQNFRRAIELQPDNPQTQLYLGYVLYKQKSSAKPGFILKNPPKLSPAFPSLSIIWA